MTDFKAGQRVRVSYEGVLGHRGSDGVHYVTFKDAAGDNRSGPVPDTGITLLPDPHPAEPTGFGSVVEVVGRRLARVDTDSLPWKVAGDDIDGEWYFSWVELASMGPVKVLFDPDQGIPG